jgi:hypothetical protein
MKTVKNIISILSLLAFCYFIYLAFINPIQLKKQAFHSGFNGTVISTLEGKRIHDITVEITTGESKCYILISAVNDPKLYPQYRDSIFKKPHSGIMYLKKDQSNEITVMDNIDCLDINCDAP